MANLTGSGAGGGTGGSLGVPALQITTQRQAVIALMLEVGFVLMLGVIAEAGPGWATSALLVIIIAWSLFLMGNAGALKDKFGGVFP